MPDSQRYPYYEAEIEARDALPLDNRRFAVPPAAQNLRILGISPRPQALSSLRSIAGVSLDLIAPQEYEKTDRSGYGLEIFHYSAPAVLPGNPALFVLPPDNNPFVDLASACLPTGRVQLARAPSTNPLCQFRSLSTCIFTPIAGRGYPASQSSRARRDHSFSQPSGAGFAKLVLGFDHFPLPGAGKPAGFSLYPKSLGLVLSGFGSGGQSYRRAAHLWLLRSRETFSLTPRGDKITLSTQAPIDFAATYFQGIYQVDRGASRELFAVNLNNKNESDLRQPTPIELRDVSNAGGKFSALFSIWPYLLLISLLLLFIEWFVNPRPLRTAFRLR